MKTIQIDEITGIWSYLQTVDWSERWLWGLGAFHFLCALLTAVTKSRGTLQSIHFVLLVYSAEIINEWASKNYRLFSKEQYFDSRGLFISIVFSVPILLNCLIIVMLWLWNVGNFISKVKRLKYKQQARAQSLKNSGNTSSSNSDAKETKKVK
ncbi:TMEM18 [Acanthosepion pharaonis]|uniref:TMEM18 n=1 Tax=Acanthosepion pharaonis TaxID=158019 RepID=A0A812ATE2_ACAPH|nr:TMEM18 [Sepia pharaonis]